MSVAILPDDHAKRGLRFREGLAIAVIRLFTGLTVTAPLSGQRALPTDVARTVRDRTSLGSRGRPHGRGRPPGVPIIEQPVPLDHHHTGRTAAGFRHRFAQFRGVLRYALGDGIWVELAGADKEAGGGAYGSVVRGVRGAGCSGVYRRGTRTASAWCCRSPVASQPVVRHGDARDVARLTTRVVVFPVPRAAHSLAGAIAVRLVPGNPILQSTGSLFMVGGRFGSVGLLDDLYGTWDRRGDCGGICDALLHGPVHHRRASRPWGLARRPRGAAMADSK